jgi:carbonic anhydrase
VSSASTDNNHEKDLEKGLKDDVDWLKGNAALPQGVAISGWIYEVETGKTKQIV